MSFNDWSELLNYGLWPGSVIRANPNPNRYADTDPNHYTYVNPNPNRYADTDPNHYTHVDPNCYTYIDPK